MRAPSLTDTLTVLLPTAEEILFLRACLQSGGAAREAFARWSAAENDVGLAINKDSSYVAHFFPLLFASSLRNEFRLEPALRSRVRAGHVLEERRGRLMQRVCEQALAGLVKGGVKVIALKGAALSESHYGGWTFRHSQDIDLLVHEHDLDRAAQRLSHAGFKPERNGRRRRSAAVRFRHALGIALELHDRLFRDGRFGAPIGPVWTRAESRTVAGVPVSVLSPDDALLHVCGQAACTASRDSLQWVCDAWRLLTRHPELDWNRFLKATIANHLSLPVSVQLTCLSRKLGAPIPFRVLDSLAGHAAQTPVWERKAALSGARRGSRASLSILLSATHGVAGKAWVLRCVLFPSPKQLRASRETSGWRLLPRYSVHRTFR